jgi:iron complex outermembrane receptor protein
VAGVDIRQRGAEGSQADLSIRGSTFEQTLVLVDGMPLGDPQTGHHSLDIPLPLDAIERIEILAGQSSRMHGPAAIGGVVNIITRQQGSPSVQLAGDAGSFNRFAASATAACSLGLTTHRVSLAKSTSDGYRYNSAYDDEAASYVAAASLGRMRLGLLGGYLDKTFGANGFYSDAFPDQW